MAKIWGSSTFFIKKRRKAAGSAFVVFHSAKQQLECAQMCACAVANVFGTATTTTIGDALTLVNLGPLHQASPATLRN